VSPCKVCSKIAKIREGKNELKKKKNNQKKDKEINMLAQGGKGIHEEGHKARNEHGTWGGHWEREKGEERRKGTEETEK